jgi:hypothetical protein
LFEKYPEEHQNFPFRDIPFKDLSSSKKFHAHCSNVMYAVDSIIDSLKDSELLVNILQKIGRNHHRNSVKPISFWVSLVEMVSGGVINWVVCSM